MIALFGARQDACETGMIAYSLVLRRNKTTGVCKQFWIRHLRLIDITRTRRLRPVALAPPVAFLVFRANGVLHLQAVHASHAGGKRIVVDLDELASLPRNVVCSRNGATTKDMRKAKIANGGILDPSSNPHDGGHSVGECRAYPELDGICRHDFLA